MKVAREDQGGARARRPSSQARRQPRPFDQLLRGGHIDQATYQAVAWFEVHYCWQSEVRIRSSSASWLGAGGGIDQVSHLSEAQYRHVERVELARRRSSIIVSGVRRQFSWGPRWSALEMAIAGKPDGRPFSLTEIGGSLGMFRSDKQRLAVATVMLVDAAWVIKVFREALQQGTSR